MAVSDETYTIDVEADKDHKSIQLALRRLAERLNQLEKEVQKNASHTH